jgi:outer membrane usher protein
MRPLSARVDRRPWLVLIGLYLWLGVARAQDSEELLLLDLCLDGTCIGVVPVLVVPDGVWIDEAAVGAAGLSVPDGSGERRAVRARPFVRIADLPEIASGDVDRVAMRLNLKRRLDTLPMQSRRVTELNRPEDRSGAVSFPLTASLDYAASVGDLTPDNVFVDGRIGKKYLVLRANAAWDEDEDYRRGLVRLEWDQPDKLVRWTAGDQFATSPEVLASSALLGGIGVARSFEQDPFLVTFPQPYLAGLLETPGTVEIYSNGVLIGRQSLSAGPFSLENIGLPTGRSDIELVFRDSFGNRRQLDSQSFYVGGGQLAAGLSDFAVRVGMPRESALGGGYGDQPALQAWYRRGLSAYLTVGGAIEADEHGQAGYVSLASSFAGGELGLSVAAADSDFDGQALAYAASYGWQQRGFGFNAGWRRRETGFRSLGELADSIAEVREDAFVSVGTIFESSFSIRANGSRSNDGRSPVSYRYGLDLGYRPSALLQGQLSVQRTEAAGLDDTAVLLNLAFSFDIGRSGWQPSSASFGTDWREDGGLGVAADVRRYRPFGEGYGYDLSLREGAGPGSAFGRAEYQGRYGRYTAEAQRVEGSATRGRFEASGSITAVGGRAHLSPPTDSGFALVRIPGMAGVEVLRENQPVGRTDARGDLLVRDLLPFYPNRIALDSDSIPMGHRHGELSRWVHAPHGAGVLVEFDVKPLRAVTGRLVDGADGLPLAGGRVLWSSLEGDVDYWLGMQGKFYQENLAPGETVWRVRVKGQDYRCDLDVPADAGMNTLGEIPCQAMPRQLEAWQRFGRS